VIDTRFTLWSDESYPQSRMLDEMRAALQRARRFTLIDEAAFREHLHQIQSEYHDRARISLPAARMDAESARGATVLAMVAVAKLPGRLPFWNNEFDDLLSDPASLQAWFEGKPGVVNGDGQTANDFAFSGELLELWEVKKLIEAYVLEIEESIDLNEGWLRDDDKLPGPRVLRRAPSGDHGKSIPPEGQKLVLDLCRLWLQFVGELGLPRSGEADNPLIRFVRNGLIATEAPDIEGGKLANFIKEYVRPALMGKV
jgi:hypothetical protein